MLLASANYCTAVSGGAGRPVRVIHVIPAIPACPVCPESGASFGPPGRRGLPVPRPGVLPTTATNRLTVADARSLMAYPASCGGSPAGAFPAPAVKTRLRPS
jgi:hypothetical protein